MKKNLLSITAALLGMMCLNTACGGGGGNTKEDEPKREFHVYLCLGQSNMEGNAPIEAQDTEGVNPRFMTLQAVDCGEHKKGEWRRAVPPLTRCGTGLTPADYFGRTLVENLPEHIGVGVINVSVGGAKIELFDEDTYAAYVAESPDWLKNMVNEYDGNPYKRLVDMAKIAKRDGGVIKGILLHQGESNGGDPEWPQKVKKVYNKLLADLELAPNSLPLLAGEMVNADQGGVCAGMNAIVATLPQVIPNAYVIPSAGCKAADDRLHFNAAGYRELGKRYAKQMLALLGHKTQANLPTFKNTGNPLINDKFTADPAPLVHNGKLYLYVGHDEYYDGQDTASGGREFNITEWLCYSTDDMQTWTDHGSVLKPTDFSWGIGEAWASQVIERDGKFYFYTTAQAGPPYNSKVVGVAVGYNPTGPFVDPIGRPLVTDDMTSNGERGWWNDIDPTAFVDDNGEAWLCWGNGTCFLAKLKPNMVELDGDIEVVDVPRFMEGPWLHKRDGIYYLTYASMGEGREAIAYATAPSMRGPWTAHGELTGMAENSFTIHPGIAEFNGENYLFYHNATLTVDGRAGAIGRRSVCVDRLYYNPDGTMKRVEQTKAGVAK